MLSNHLLQLISFIGILNLLLANLAESAPVVATSQLEATKSEALPKLKRDSRAKVTALELLDSQETGYLPNAYQTDSDYGYDSGKNTYGKQAADWSLYDQGRCRWHASVINKLHRCFRNSLHFR